MKHAFLCLLFLPLMASSPVLKQGEMSPVNFDVITLGDGIYACINTFEGKAICNAGIVDNGESTIIFDTFLSPEAAEELIQLVGRLKLSPIRFVVNSHCHNDHVRGNQSFSPEVKILSTRRTAELMERDEPISIAAEKIYGPVQYAYFDSLRGTYKGDTTAREYQIIKMNRAYFEELSKSHERIRSRIPDTFVAKEHSIDGSRRRVRLQDKGKGHTESDLIMYLPDEGVVFAGDLVFHKCHPYLGDGDLDGWKSILSEMALMNVKTVVPGHGPVGGIESIAEMKSYIDSIEVIARQLKHDGRRRQDIKTVPIPEKFKDWWMEDFFQGNVEFAYDKAE